LLGGHWWRALREATTYTMLHHRLPRPGFRRLRARRAQALPLLNPIPQWMRPEFIRAAHLEERWRAVERAAERDAQHHPWRPEAYGKLVSWFWPRMFEEMDPGFTGVPVHVRHPLMDLRVVRFLLRVPPAQWYNDKGILVAAMKGRLPDRVRFRNKTPLVGDANAVALAAGGVPATELQRVSPRIEPYVDPAGFGTTPSSPDSDDSWDWLRAVSLSEWLARVERGDSFVRAGRARNVTDAARSGRSMAPARWISGGRQRILFPWAFMKTARPQRASPLVQANALPRQKPGPRASPTPRHR
jgi:asparagine synthase (glutamine-hydrolysing)